MANAFVTATTSARDIYENPASGWTSATRCVTFSGPGAAPLGTAPGYPAQGSCSAGQSSLSFDASGRATGFSITLYKAETTALTVTGAAKTGTAGTTVVNPGTATGFLVIRAGDRDRGHRIHGDVIDGTRRVQQHRYRLLRCAHDRVVGSGFGSERYCADVPGDVGVVRGRRRARQH